VHELVDTPRDDALTPERSLHARRGLSSLETTGRGSRRGTRGASRLAWPAVHPPLPSTHLDDLERVVIVRHPWGQGSPRSAHRRRGFLLEKGAEKARCCGRERRAAHGPDLIDQCDDAVRLCQRLAAGEQGGLLGQACGVWQLTPPTVRTAARGTRACIALPPHQQHMSARVLRS
jgi:hypothetical protein